jgi:sulfur carrier protein
MNKISVNNEMIEINTGTMLHDALVQWGYGDGKIAVAINGEFVARSGYSERELQNGDAVDIVKPVGGG